MVECDCVIVGETLKSNYLRGKGPKVINEWYEASPNVGEQVPPNTVTKTSGTGNLVSTK